MEDIFFFILLVALSDEFVCRDMEGKGEMCFHCVCSMLFGLFGSEIFNLLIISTRTICFLAFEVSVLKILICKSIGCRYQVQ